MMRNFSMSDLPGIIFQNGVDTVLPAPWSKTHAVMAEMPLLSRFQPGSLCDLGDLQEDVQRPLLSYSGRSVYREPMQYSRSSSNPIVSGNMSGDYTPRSNKVVGLQFLEPHTCLLSQLIQLTIVCALHKGCGIVRRAVNAE